MYKKMAGLLLAAIAAMAGVSATALAQTDGNIETTGGQYRWNNVAIGGGSYVTGVVFHPTEPNLIYIQTDVGGCYRWDPTGRQWIQLMDCFGPGEANLYGVQLTLDPNNPDVVYAAAGKYPKDIVIKGHLWTANDPYPCDVLKSTDRGKTWQRTGLNVDMGGNQMPRKATNHMAVDPNDSNIIYYGSGWNGLWRSTQAAAPGSWRQVTSVPTHGVVGRGFMFITFDAASGKKGLPTPVMFTGVQGKGIFRSADAGENWTHIGGPEFPHQGRVALDGTLYITHDKGVIKFADGKWINITPRAPGAAPKEQIYNALSLSMHDPKLLMVVTRMGRYGEEISRSTDGGATWTQVTDYKKHYSAPWWNQDFWAEAVASLAMDPQDERKVWMTTWYGVWRTDNVTANPSYWVTEENGHEEVGSLSLISTPGGASLHSGVFDVGAFRHADLRKFPNEMFCSPEMKDSTSYDFCEADPNCVVRVGGNEYYQGGTGGGLISRDNGKTWVDFAAKPEGAYAGRVAMSCGDSQHIVWRPFRKPMYFTKDGGRTWAQGKGLPPADQFHDYWSWNQYLVADRAVADRFYFLADRTGQVYRSDDGGENWQAVGQIPVAPTRWYGLVSSYGKNSELWVYLHTAGLYRSTDGGKSFQRMDQIQEALLASFGKGAPNGQHPAAYCYATINGRRGMYRSDDMGATWVAIGPPNYPGDEPSAIAGDRNVYGRVFVGTNGRGIYYGEPMSDSSARP